jgi:hypothetical protein
MRSSKPIGRRSVLTSAPHVHVQAHASDGQRAAWRASALARTARKRAMIVAALGPDGGLVSYRSSPHFMWLCDRLAGRA